MKIQDQFKTFSERHFKTFQEGIKELEELIQESNKFLKNHYKWRDNYEHN